MRATLRWASSRSPRNVTFQSARPPDKATGRRDKVLELLLFKQSSHISKFSATPTLLNKIDDSLKLLRWVARWDFYFSTGSAAGLRDDVCLLYTDYIACFCEVISVRDNVFMMFPWFKWILHLNLSTKSQFSRLKISTFGHENLCVLSTYKAIFFRWKRSFHQDCLQTKLTIMWKIFPYERSFSIWKWSISSTSLPSIFA